MIMEQSLLSEFFFDEIVGLYPRICFGRGILSGMPPLIVSHSHYLLILFLYSLRSGAEQTRRFVTDVTLTEALVPLKKSIAHRDLAFS